MSKMDPVIELALNARSSVDVDQLEEALRAAMPVTVRFLGDREANFSAIGGPADAAAVLFERVTNMWDATIELEAQRLGRHDWPTPAAAVSELFTASSDLPADRKEAIARAQVVTLYDSEDPRKRPTIGFRDHGIGLTSSEMPDTILSLERSNKLKKFYLHGVFGKGGSSASVYSRATVIVTRKQPELLLPGDDDRVSLAVVREEDAPDVRLPFYRYLVRDDGTQLPYSVAASRVPGFAPGTLVLHIAYDAGRMALQNWEFEESIYAYAETLLFKPTLPYSLHDARSEGANVRPQDRRKPSTLSGLAQRLERMDVGPGLIERTDWTSVPVPDVGHVRMRWWLFDDVDARRRRAAKGYVVLFTTNGQIHHAWDQTRFQQLVENRRRVTQRILVEVDCDGIENKRRVRVFDTFRTQVRRGPEGRALEEAIGDALREDPDLSAHEDDLIRQSLKSSAGAVSASFRSRLNKLIKLKVPGLAGLTDEGASRRRTVPQPKPQPDLYPEPTYFTGPEEVSVVRGQRASFFMEMNAVDSFVPERGSVTVTSVDRDTLLQFGVGDLRRGRLRLSVVAPDEVDIASCAFEVGLEWQRKDGGMSRMSWPVTITVIAAPPEKKEAGGKTGSKVKDSGDVAFLWSSTRDNQEADWDDDVPGELQQIKGSVLASLNPAVYMGLRNIEVEVPTIVLNEDFTDWSAYRKRVAKQVSDEQLNHRRDRYGLALGANVARLAVREHQLKEKYETWQRESNGLDAPPKPMDKRQMFRATAEAARSVLALLPEFDRISGDD